MKRLPFVQSHFRFLSSVRQYHYAVAEHVAAQYAHGSLIRLIAFAQFRTTAMEGVIIGLFIAQTAEQTTTDT